MRREKDEQSPKTLNTLHNTKSVSFAVFIEFPLCARLCYFKTIDPSIAAVEPGFHLFHIPSLKCTQRFSVILKMIN